MYHGQKHGQEITEVLRQSSLLIHGFHGYFVYVCVYASLYLSLCMIHLITCSMLGFSNGGLSWASNIGLPICRMDFLNSCYKKEILKGSGQMETQL